MSKEDEIRAGMAILKDLELFNKAACFLEEQIDPRIRTAVTEFVTVWIEERCWEGVPDVSEHFEDMWLCPAAWKEEDEEPFARFKFGYRANVDTGSYPIADLFGVGQSDFGFRFQANYSWFGGKTGWNTLVKAMTGLSEEIVQAGWQHEGKGVFFRSVTLSANHLVSAWENDDWSLALEPLGNALDALEVDKAIFERIAYKAKLIK